MIATALSLPGGTPKVVEAREPSAELVDLAVDSAGGLTCSWRAGPPRATRRVAEQCE